MKLLDFIKHHKYKNYLYAFLISFTTYIYFFGNFLLPSHYFWGSDAQNFYVPARYYLHEKILESGVFPFWTERIFNGFPIYADAEVGYLNPINVLSILIFGPALSYKLLHLFFYLIGSLCFYSLLNRKKLNLLSFFVANIIFYFNTFMINHQIHFNIILTFYLLPAGILLVDLYLENPKIKYIILQSIIISFSILYGHIQSSLIFCLGVGLYYMVFAGKKLLSKYTILYLIFLSLMILIQTLPQVFSSKELFETSVRGSKFNLYQGSMYPNMFTFVFLPYQFGERKDYIGKDTKTDFTYTEIYIYMGISSFALYISSLLFLKTSKISIYSYLTLWLFLIFFMLAHNRFFDNNTPIISSFRHWERMVILFIFGTSLSVANFLSNLKEFNLDKFYLRVIYVLIPLLYLRYYFKLVPYSASFQRVKEILSWNAFQLHKDFYQTLTFAGIIFFGLLLLLINLRFKNLKILIVVQTIMLFTVFYDLSFFSKDVLNFRLQNISEYKLPEFSHQPPNERTLFLKYEIYGLEHLYYKSWSPLGYSQFLEKDYKNFTKDNGFKELMSGNGYIKIPESYILKNFGVANINFFGKDLKNTYQTVPHNGLDLIKENIEAKYLVKQEGKVIFESRSAVDDYINLLLKYNNNWEIKINEQKTPYSQNGIYLQFKLPAGDNKVEITYIPKPFYFGLKISILLLVFTLLGVWLTKKYNIF